jgi:hypothetical protein
MFYPNWYAVVMSLVSVVAAYEFCDWLMKKIPKYNRIKPARQQYIVKNLVKGVYLLLLTIYALPYAYDMVFKGIWPNGTLHTLNFLYAIPDLVGLIRVRGLHLMTKVHHSLVLCLTISGLFIDFTNSYWQWFLTYGLLSMFAWTVNLFLGGWRLLPKEQYRRLGAATVLLNYGLCLITNWVWQTWHFFKWVPMASCRQDYVGIMFGTIILFLIAADDILLVMSLKNHVNVKKMLKAYTKPQ